jgi:MoxR-like ATPase
MNDMTQPVAVDLSFYTKDALIEIAKRAGATLGDYARKTKSEIRMTLEAYPADRVTAAIEACTNEGIFEEEEKDDEPAPAPAKPVSAPAGAADQLAAALMAMIPATPVDMESVEQMVDNKIKDSVASIIDAVTDIIEPKVETVFIRADESSHKVDGEAHAMLKKVVGHASIRDNILLVGPAGCGKTHLADQAAKALGLEFSSISCTAGMSESQLLGWLLPIGDGGKFEYVQSEFVRLYENGGVYLLDEMDAADANTLMILNQALANGGFYVPQARRMVKRHPDFVCIAAANTYGHGGDMVYAGRERLDSATLDRFRTAIIPMDYDKKLEAALIDAEVLAWGQAIRTKIDSLKLRRVMSTRAMIGFTKQTKALGYGVKDWEASYFADWSRDELAKVGR